MRSISLHKGFTLIEVLVTVAVSSVLFLTIANLMTTMVTTNTSIKDNIGINDEKETVFLTLKNHLDEAEQVVYPTSLTENAENFFIVQNSVESDLLPFTAFVTSQDNVNAARNLKVYNFGFSTQTQQPVSSIASPNEGGYCLDFYNNRVLKSGSCVKTDTLCQDGNSTECVIAGGSDENLQFGLRAFAPYIRIQKPTDLRISGNILYILSPYEQREYQIQLDTLQVSAISLSNDGFYYRYNGTTPTKADFSVLPNFTGITPLESRYSLTRLSLLRNVYASTSPYYQLDQIIYTLAKPENDNVNSENGTSFFLFKLFRR